MRTVTFWLVLLASATGRAEMVTVAMDARAVDSTAYRELGLLALQRELALRLTEAGYAVVAPQREPRVRVRFQVEGQELKLEVSAGSAAVTRQVARGDGKLATFHLEVIHRVMALVREAERSLPPSSQPQSAPTSRPASRPATRPASRPPPPRPPPPSPAREPAAQPWQLELALGAMALYRPGGVDLLARGSGRIGVLGGLGLRGAVAFAPSWTDDLTVFELSAQGGLSWRFQLTPALHLEPGLFAGVLQHIYTFAGSGDDSGLRWDFLGNLTLELGWRLHRYFGLRLFLSPGLTTQSRVHTEGGSEIWRRSLFRLETGACVVVVLR